MKLDLAIHPQPTDTTCGPTCLHAVYRYLGDGIDLETTIRQVRQLDEGGTLAVMLGLHALERGYRAALHTSNVSMLDPTWFDDAGCAKDGLIDRLCAQARAKRDDKLEFATDGYVRFLQGGGEVRFGQLGESLIADHLARETPLIAGLSATYLYRCAREIDDDYDDVRGLPSGHFVVLTGVDRKAGHVEIADPLHDNPRFGVQHYTVNIDRLIDAILLGIVTYDANLLILDRPSG